MLLFPDATKPTTTVNVTYKVGSRQENYGETGMAHLLEHMLFKGTPSVPSVFAELGRRGMQFNGNTSYDRTTYFETFTASQPSLDWVLKMEAERMTRSTFSKPELDSEMTVVRNEYESGENQPQSVLWKRMAAVAFDWHNYGKPTIGARSDIENVPFEQLRAFYRMYYQPDNAVLTIAGKFDADRDARDRSPGTSARFRRPTRALPKLYTVEPVQDGERIGHRAPRRQRAMARRDVPPAAGRQPGLRRRSRRSREIMTVEPAGRLYKALVEGKKASSVENWLFPQHDAGLRHLLGAGAERRIDRRGARHDARDAVRRRRASDHRRRARPRAHEGAEGLRRHDQRSGADGRRARRRDRGRRLAAVLHPPRPLAHGDAGRRHARGAASG